MKLRIKATYLFPHYRGAIFEAFKTCRWVGKSISTHSGSPNNVINYYMRMYYHSFPRSTCMQGLWASSASEFCYIKCTCAQLPVLIRTLPDTTIALNWIHTNSQDSSTRAEMSTHRSNSMSCMKFHPYTLGLTRLTQLMLIMVFHFLPALTWIRYTSACWSCSRVSPPTTSGLAASVFCLLANCMGDIRVLGTVSLRETSISGRGVSWSMSKTDTRQMKHEVANSIAHCTKCCWFNR